MGVRRICCCSISSDGPHQHLAASRALERFATLTCPIDIHTHELTSHLIDSQVYEASIHEVGERQIPSAAIWAEQNSSLSGPARQATVKARHADSLAPNTSARPCHSPLVISKASNRIRRSPSSHPPPTNRHGLGKCSRRLPGRNLRYGNHSSPPLGPGESGCRCWGTRPGRNTRAPRRHRSRTS